MNLPQISWSFFVGSCASSRIGDRVFVLRILSSARDFPGPSIPQKPTENLGFCQALWKTFFCIETERHWQIRTLLLVEG